MGKLTCPYCNGVIRTVKKQTVEQVLIIHRRTCPSPLAGAPKSKKLK